MLKSLENHCKEVRKSKSKMIRELLTFHLSL
ncbi:ribbon-helix-helix protein, CopG family [Hymenobacter sp. UYAg731]